MDFTQMKADASNYSGKTDVEEARKIILGSYAEGVRDFSPTEFPREYFPKTVDSALDFGCGLGRNLPSIKKISGVVDGYDFPNMVDMAGETCARKLYTDWGECRKNKYGVIVSFIVIEHIQPEYLVEYLKDFAIMSNYFYFDGRTWIDGKKELVLPYILKNFKRIKMNKTPDEVMTRGFEDDMTFRGLFKSR